jgi:hypothetical protein
VGGALRGLARRSRTIGERHTKFFSLYAIYIFAIRTEEVDVGTGTVEAFSAELALAATDRERGEYPIAWFDMADSSPTSSTIPIGS